jgi:amidase
MSDQHWEKIAAAKRAALLGNIPPEYRIPSSLYPPESQLDVTKFPRESGWFSQRELDITESTATAIVGKIAARAWSSEEVTRAFCKRAAAAHQLVSARYHARFDARSKS